MTGLATLVVLLVAVSVGTQERDPKLQDFDVLGTSDLTTVPLHVDLFTRLALKFRDSVLEEQWTEQVQKLGKTLDERLVDGYGGYLVEAVLYVDDLGNVRVPGGTMLVPVGPGSEPLDALAKDLAVGGFRNQPPPPPFRDRSHYIWYAKAAGKLTSVATPREATKSFRDRAHQEMRRRQLQAAVPRSSIERSLTRAKFWLQAEKEYLAKVEDARARGEIAKLTGEMRILEDKADSAYAEFQSKRLDLMEASQHLAFLERLSSIASIVDAGLKAGDMLTSDNKTASASAGTEYPVAERIRLTKTRVDGATGDVKTAELEYVRYDTSVRRKEQQVRQVYEQNGVEVPPRR